jgi:hypothetical protein
MEQRTAAAPRSLSLVMVHKTPSLMELTWDRISPTQLNCILETGGLSNAGVTGQASVVGVVAPIHQKAMPAKA